MSVKDYIIGTCDSLESQFDVKILLAYIDEVIDTNKYAVKFIYLKPLRDYLHISSFELKDINFNDTYYDTDNDIIYSIQYEGTDLKEALNNNIPTKSDVSKTVIKGDWSIFKDICNEDDIEELNQRFLDIIYQNESYQGYLFERCIDCINSNGILKNKKQRKSWYSDDLIILSSNSSNLRDDYEYVWCELGYVFGDDGDFFCNDFQTLNMMLDFDYI